MAARARCGARSQRKDDDAFAGCARIPERDARARRFRAALRVLCPCADRARHARAAARRGSATKPTTRSTSSSRLPSPMRRSNTPSLEGFLHWVERGGAEIKRDMERGRDEVRVMTVHGAKGLEADIVILPDTTTLPEQPGAKGHLLYTEDGVLFPLAEGAAPEPVSRAKALAAKDDAEGASAPALCRAHPRQGPALSSAASRTSAASGTARGTRCAAARGRDASACPSKRDGETILVLGDAPDEEAEPRLPLDAAPLKLADWVTAPAPRRATRAAPRAAVRRSRAWRSPLSLPPRDDQPLPARPARPHPARAPAGDRARRRRRAARACATCKARDADDAEALAERDAAVY